MTNNSNEVVVISWVCVALFAMTAGVTLLGILERPSFIQVRERYLKMLVTSLLLEVVGIGVFAFKMNISTAAASPRLEARAKQLEGLVGDWTLCSYPAADQLFPGTATIAYDQELDDLSVSGQGAPLDKSFQFTFSSDAAWVKAGKLEFVYRNDRDERGLASGPFDRANEEVRLAYTDLFDADKDGSQKGNMLLLKGEQPCPAQRP